MSDYKRPSNVPFQVVPDDTSPPPVTPVAVKACETLTLTDLLALRVALETLFEEGYEDEDIAPKLQLRGVDLSNQVDYALRQARRKVEGMIDHVMLCVPTLDVYLADNE